MEDLLLVRLLGGRVSHSDSVNRFGLDSFASTRLYPSLRSVNPYTICHFVGYYLYPSLRSEQPVCYSLPLVPSVLGGYIDCIYLLFQSNGSDDAMDSLISITGKTI